MLSQYSKVCIWRHAQKISYRCHICSTVLQSYKIPCIRHDSYPLQDAVLTNFAACQDYFELGVILLRKKLFTQATKNLEKAKKTWSGEPDELAQAGS